MGRIPEYLLRSVSCSSTVPLKFKDLVKSVKPIMCLQTELLLRHCATLDGECKERSNIIEICEETSRFLRNFHEMESDFYKIVSIVRDAQFSSSLNRSLRFIKILQAVQYTCVQKKYNLQNCYKSSNILNIKSLYKIILELIKDKILI